MDSSIAGLTIDRWVIDALHTWALGPLGSLVALVIHVLLKTGIFKPGSALLAPEDANRLAMMQIRSLMQSFYKENKDIGTKVAQTCVYTHSTCFYRLPRRSNN